MNIVNAEVVCFHIFSSSGGDDISVLLLPKYSSVPIPNLTGMANHKGIIIKKKSGNTHKTTNKLATILQSYDVAGHIRCGVVVSVLSLLDTGMLW